MGLGSLGFAPWLGDHPLGVGLLEFLEGSSYKPVYLGGLNREQGQFYVGWTAWVASHGVSLEERHVGKYVGGG